ncbi:hypothetical protein E2C01_100706 [Portunus trituberculatus]|uniref:Uncharacterized protein n=1 Tax=Portunus trituberculatus TaxID=210409 RepID=A0A5B7KIL1_PORTR|nr:hypothetical protein [Portunus trituberculatus]
MPLPTCLPSPTTGSTGTHQAQLLRRPSLPPPHLLVSCAPPAVCQSAKECAWLGVGREGSEESEETNG